MYQSVPAPIRLTALHRRILYAVFLSLWCSGALWLVFHHFLRMPGDFGPRPHALEIWWLRLHGLAAFAGLVTIGSVLPIHARRAWQFNKNRLTGLSVKTVLVWLAGSGYALYYFASDENQAWLPLLHWIVGLCVPLILFVHVRQGRRKRRSAPRRVREPAMSAERA